MGFCEAVCQASCSCFGGNAESSAVLWVQALAGSEIDGRYITAKLDEYAT